MQPRSWGKRQTGLARSATATRRPASDGSRLSMSAKKRGITARGWQALGKTALGSGAGVPSAPQNRPPLRQSRQPDEARAASAMPNRSTRALYREHRTLRHRTGVAGRVRLWYLAPLDVRPEPREARAGRRD